MNINLNYTMPKFSSIKANNKHYFHNKITPLHTDTISFSAKKEQNPVSKFSQEAIQVGIDLYNKSKTEPLSLEHVQKELEKEIPIVQVKDIKTLPQYANQTGLLRMIAYYLPKYDDDGNLYELSMYLDNDIKTVAQFSSLVHEYTHLLQRYNDDTHIGAFSIIGEKNINLARGLNGLSSFVFDHLQSNKDEKIFKIAAKQEQRGKQADKALAEAYGYKNLESFKKAIVQYFDKAYPTVLTKVLSNEQNKEFMPFLDNPTKLKNAVKQMCIKHAQMEQEAYESQYQFIKKVDKHSLTDTNKMNPVYYKIIAEALSESMK